MKNEKLILTCAILSELLFCGCALAQIPVQEESHHTLILDNEFVRVIEGKISAGDTTLAHLHSANSVVLFLSKSTFGIKILGGAPVIAEVNPGDMRYLPYGDKPVTHRVWNQSQSILHFVVIEMVKHHSTHASCLTPAQSGLKLIVDQEVVRAAWLDISGSKPYYITKSNCAYLLIAISGTITTEASGRETLLRPGDLVFFGPQHDVEISTVHGEVARCALVELR